MYSNYPPHWKFNADDNTIYMDRVVVGCSTVRRMVMLADSYLEGCADFYWSHNEQECIIKRNVTTSGIEIQISIVYNSNCQISILGKPDVMGVAAGPSIWTGDLERMATSYSHLLAFARQALIDHLEKED